MSQETSRHHSEEPHAKLLMFMFVRRRLSWLIGLWLLCQAANLGAAPVTFSCQNVASADDEEECCPGLLPGQVCPMHHAKKGERTCTMRSTCAQSDGALVALSVGIGALPPATPVVSAFDLGDLPRSTPRSAIVRAYRPESPPPRA